MDAEQSWGDMLEPACIHHVTEKNISYYKPDSQSHCQGICRVLLYIIWRTQMGFRRYWVVVQFRNLTPSVGNALAQNSYYIVLYCTVLYCTVLYSGVLHCAVLYCTALYCTVLYCTPEYCTVLYCTVLYCTVLCCTVLYCTALHCTSIYRTTRRTQSSKRKRSISVFHALAVYFLHGVGMRIPDRDGSWLLLQCVE